LNHCIVLSPFAAKGLTELMQKLMTEYEALRRVVGINSSCISLFDVAIPQIPKAGDV
jgi:hypothetical protein